MKTHIDDLTERYCWIRKSEQIFVSFIKQLIFSSLKYNINYLVHLQLLTTVSIFWCNQGDAGGQQQSETIGWNLPFSLLTSSHLIILSCLSNLGWFKLLRHNFTNSQVSCFLVSIEPALKFYCKVISCWNRTQDSPWPKAKFFLLNYFSL